VALNLKFLHLTKAFHYESAMGVPSHLKSLQALEIAARTGSFVAAAEVLAITPAAVGQRVKALEDYLGVELIVRGRAGIHPTAAAAQAIAHLSRGFAAIADASEMLDLQRPQDLHIAACPDFAELWLAPRLAAFRAEHPQMRLSVNGQGDAPARHGGPDCEILFDAPSSDAQDDLLFHDFVVPIASPMNVERTSVLSEETRLEGFPLLHLDFYKDDPVALSWPQWFERQGYVRTAPERGMRFRRIEGALASVRADAGIALCGVAMIADLLEQGRLGKPYPMATGWHTSHAYVAHFRPRRTTAQIVSHFRNWLQAQAAQTRGWLERFIA